MIQYENVDDNSAPTPHQVSEAALGHESTLQLAEQLELFPDGMDVLTIQ